MNAEDLDTRFPRTSKYAPDWIKEGAMGSHVLWMTEWLCEKMDLRPGMRVLDLGCGRCKSSVFLAREFDVQVWATDLWISATENRQRIVDDCYEDRVFPIHADARALPFAADFFDAILAIDCYSYFGTDDLYLNYLTQFVKPGGPIGIAGAALVQELTGPVPEHLRDFWSQDFWCLHSPSWWRQHWERTGLVDVVVADGMEEAWRLWSQWQRLAWPDNAAEYGAVETDAGRTLGYVRMVGRRRTGIQLSEYAWPDTMRSMPQQYEKKQMLRDTAEIRHS